MPTLHHAMLVSLSARSLSTTEESVLAQGLNFVIAPRKIPVPDINAAVEAKEASARSLSAAQLAGTMITVCLVKARPLPTYLCPAEQKATRSLSYRHVEDIVIMEMLRL